MQDSTKQTVLAFLQKSPGCHDSSLCIDWGERQGSIHLRNGTIVAAETGLLSGNGAVLDIVRWQNATVTEIDGAPAVKKNVTLALHDIEDLFNRLSVTPLSAPTLDETADLKRAIQLIHQFQYREAGTCLTDILRYNRFNYLAWLWYSRLLGKIDGIRRALDEARKWGDHDPEVWLEVKKTGVGIANSEGGDVKRCLFCWAPLNRKDDRCCYCLALQAIGKKPGRDLKRAEVKNAINRYIGGLKSDRTNGRTGYTLALAFYNLSVYDRALQYLDFVVKLSPRQPLYTEARTFVTGLLAPPGGRVPAAVTGSGPATPAVADRVQQGPVILVIEDSPTARKVINLVLSREGYGIIEASSGQDALGKAAAVRPSLILLDVMLPDMTGYDILPRLREFKHLAETPVIMLTGRKGSMDKMKGLMAGSAEYLTKPFDPQKLTTTIKKYL